MSRYNGSWEWWEYAALAVTLTLCLGLIMWFCYGIWGPHTPPPPFDPKQAFVESCQQYSGVPDVHTNTWTCQGKEN